MREIKFRAWINKLSLYAEYVMIHSGGGFVAYYDTVSYYNCELEQYTGKRDYAVGDVFEIEDKWPKYILMYREDISAYVLASEGGPYYSFERIKKEELIVIKIGNIHENPELLK